MKINKKIKIILVIFGLIVLIKFIFLKTFCPDILVYDKMPTLCLGEKNCNNRGNSYFIKNGKRKESNQYNDWFVKNVCKTRKEVVW